MKRLLSISIILLLTALPSFALDVPQTVWGFNGQIVPNRVYPVSMLLHNPSDKPFDGVLELHRTMPLVGRVGERNIQPCFISARESKWVQFYVFASENDAWVLSWGAGANNSFLLPTPNLGTPARVLITTGDQMTARGPRMKTFPEFLFPPAVGALDGLHSAVLDYAPKWEAVRREAFLDWVRRGGILHLINDPTGKQPAFADDLAVLNTPLDKFQVGNGLVLRHAVTRREISDDWLNERGFTLPELKETMNAFSRLEDRLLEQVSSFTQPRFQWAMIYLMAFLYVVLIGPVNFVVGRRIRDYRWSVVFLIGCVTLFMLIFNLLGRGYGNQSVAHVFAYVRPLGNGFVDVTQWANVFAARSGQYELTHQSPHNIYATCHQYEPVNGVALNGKDGKLILEMPLNTSRSFLHRGKIKCESPSVSIKDWSATNHLRKLTLDVSLPEGMELLDSWVSYNGKIHTLNHTSGQLSLSSYSVKSLGEFVSSDEMQFPTAGRWGSDSEPPDPQTQFRKSARAVVVHALGGGAAFQHAMEDNAMATQRAQLFLLAKSPPALNVAHKDFSKQVSFVLFHIQLFEPE